MLTDETPVPSLVKNAQDILKKKGLKSDLMFIKIYFEEIPSNITKLEGKLKTCDACQVVENMKKIDGNTRRNWS